MRAANENIWQQLELFFEESRVQREQKAEARRQTAISAIAAKYRPAKEVVELVPWPPHMRFD